MVLKTVFPLLGTLGHEWVSELMGSSLTSQLDALQVLTVRKVSGVLRCPSSVWRFLSLVLKTRFPSVVKSKHGWRTATHVQGRNGKIMLALQIRRPVHHHADRGGACFLKR